MGGTSETSGTIPARNSVHSSEPESLWQKLLEPRITNYCSPTAENTIHQPIEIKAATTTNTGINTSIGKYLENSRTACLNFISS